MYSVPLNQLFRAKVGRSPAQSIRDDHRAMAAWLRGYMRDRSYDRAIACFDLMLALTRDDVRKDGVTPESCHQMRIAMLVVASKQLGFPMPDEEQLLCYAFTHDILENKPRWNVPRLRAALDARLPDRWRANIITAAGTLQLSKTVEDRARFPNEAAYLADTLAPRAPVDRDVNAMLFFLKLKDHCENLSTATVLKPDSLRRYYWKTMRDYAPHIRAGRALFPEYGALADRYGWMMGKMLTNLMPLVPDSGAGPPPRLRFDFRSAWRDADRDIPPGLRLCAILRGNIARLGREAVATRPDPR